jgi:serine protease Do/serine protease DegQ
MTTRFRAFLGLSVLASALFVPPSVAQQLSPPPAAPAPVSALAAIAAGPTLAPVVEAVTPGVVGISVSQRSAGNPLLNDPAFRRFFEESERERPGRRNGDRAEAPEVRPAGSGVVIDAQQGLVLTNHHVVQGASRIVVVLKDRREVVAELVGSDAGTDIAVLRIRADRLSAVRLGDSDTARVGDFVIAIGNPFGLGQTVTTGIVSALGRGISPEGYEDYIQTDAAINPGNSGGALVNLRGELIGINTAILSGRGSGGSGGGNIGIGFAVPTSMAREVVAQILRNGEVRRGRIGAQLAEVTQEIAHQRGLPAIAGAVVREVSRGSAAERAGLRPDDIVLQVNGRPVRTSSDLRNRVALIPVGSIADMQVWRRGAPSSVRITVEPAAAEQVASAQDAPSGRQGLNRR